MCPNVRHGGQFTPQQEADTFGQPTPIGLLLNRLEIALNLIQCLVRSLQLV